MKERIKDKYTNFDIDKLRLFIANEYQDKNLLRNEKYIDDPDYKIEKETVITEKINVYLIPQTLSEKKSLNIKPSISIKEFKSIVLKEYDLSL